MHAAISMFLALQAPPLTIAPCNRYGFDVLIAHATNMTSVSNASRTARPVVHINPPPMPTELSNRTRSPYSTVTGVPMRNYYCSRVAKSTA